MVFADIVKRLALSSFIYLYHFYVKLRITKLLDQMNR